MKFREFILGSGKLILGGKNSKNNEELLSQVGKNEIVLHTKNPGSPFVNIKGKATRGDTKEAAIFCASFSQAWKKPKIKKDIEVHYFLGKEVYKNSDMKEGTFGVKKFKVIKVNKKEIEEFLKQWQK